MKKHGMCNTNIYVRWSAMKARCNNPNAIKYKDYGGRGIKVCDDWEQDFIKFKEWAVNTGYKKELCIDRIDNDKGYSPENCQWITHAENNSKGKKREKASKYEGCKTTGIIVKKGKYRARVFINGKSVTIGIYDTEQIAKEMRAKYVQELKSNNILEHV